jgi:hypothetical protein
MIYMFALSTQEALVYDLHVFLENQGIGTIEHKYIDVNEEAKTLADELGFVHFPTIFELKHVNGANILTKLAEGADIKQSSPETLAAIKAVADSYKPAE